MRPLTCSLIAVVIALLVVIDTGGAQSSGATPPADDILSPESEVPVLEITHRKPPARPGRMHIRAEDLIPVLQAELRAQTEQPKFGEKPVQPESSTPPPTPAVEPEVMPEPPVEHEIETLPPLPGEPVFAEITPEENGKTKKAPDLAETPPTTERLIPVPEELPEPSVPEFTPLPGPATETVESRPEEEPPATPAPEQSETPEDTPHSTNRIANLHYELAMEFYHAGNLDQAVEEYNAAMAVDSTFITPDQKAKLHYDFGVDYHKKGDYDAAMFHYKKAIYFNDNFAPAHANLGAIYLRMGARDAAAAEFRRAQEIESQQYH
ncbi:MAG: tetratricopeptide repeat protein [Gemmatimonadetes bacterium]|nr:MAG: tetratricopeptide repeat protein [Gemmatimonadota bacterium]